MFFSKEKSILVSLEKLSLFANTFIPCKFCNNPIQVEEDNDKLLGLACFLKIVCQNEKCLKSKINSLTNISTKNGQFFEINQLFVLACDLVGHGHSATKKLTSILNMTQPVSKVAWKRHTKAITHAAVNVSNNSMEKLMLEVKKYLVSNTSYTPRDDLLQEVTEVSLSVDGFWGLQRIFHEYYDEYYDGDLNLVTTDESSCSVKLEAELMTLYHMKCFLEKKKSILISLEKLSTFVNAFTPCNFCNNPIQVEEDNDNWLGLVCFLKIVCQNEKCFKS